jgi:stage III sporulation protein AG
MRSKLLLAGLVGLGMLFLLASSAPRIGVPPARQAEKAGEVSATLGGRDDYREKLEQELAGILSRVKGVGKVVVLITLESGPSSVYGENRETTARLTTEDDAAGGRREVEESTSRTEVVVSREGQGERPLLLMEIKPRLRGVMVIAEGAADPQLRERLVLALQAGLGVAAHRITVLPMK